MRRGRVNPIYGEEHDKGLFIIKEGFGIQGKRLFVTKLPMVGNLSSAPPPLFLRERVHCQGSPISWREGAKKREGAHVREAGPVRPLLVGREVEAVNPIRMGVEMTPVVGPSGLLVVGARA